MDIAGGWPSFAPFHVMDQCLVHTTLSSRRGSLATTPLSILLTTTTAHTGCLKQMRVVEIAEDQTLDRLHDTEARVIRFSWKARRFKRKN